MAFFSFFFFIRVDYASFRFSNFACLFFLEETRATAAERVARKVVSEFQRIEGGRGRATGQAKRRWPTDQGRGAEQFVPVEHHFIEIQIVQHDLGYAHEHFFSLQTPIVAPHCHLRNKKFISYVINKKIIFR